jgi:two-component system sensor histidine kinase BaeS
MGSGFSTRAIAGRLRGWRPGLTARLFLALLALTLTTVVLMSVVVQLSFRSEFLDYVRAGERQRVGLLSGMLADYYRLEGDWSELAQTRDWRRLLRDELWSHHGEGGADSGVDDTRPAPAARELAYAGESDVTLLDIAQHRVAGPDVQSADVQRLAIRVDGMAVGWLAFRPSSRITDRLALGFQRRQLHTAWWIALVVAVLAALVSALLARGFLAPVRRLGVGARALSAGRFETRVEASRRDELGRLARDFNRLAETLERNEGLRRAFMADMSHELRTPLSVVRAGLEAMEDGVRPLTRESLAGLQTSVAALSKLIDDLYALSLADTGALTYRMQPMNLAAAVAEIAEPWRAHLADAGLTLALVLPQVPVPVQGDRGRLAQLLDNLLHNSRRYTHGYGSVHIELTRRGDEAVLCVEDSAPGVTAVDRARLFERLYRVEGSRSRRSGGSGLGLAICRNIAEAHGGHISAYAAPRGGVGIRLVLPLAEPGRRHAHSSESGKRNV